MARIIFVLATTLGLSALISFLGCDDRASVVVVVNGSSTDIENGTVSICGESVVVGRISAGTSKRLGIHPSCESHFDVRVKLSNGDERSAQVGYVAPGLSMRNEIIVGHDEISFKASELE